jgi:ankyrin repeat protein
MAVLSTPKKRLAVVVLGVLLALALIRYVFLRNDHFRPNSLPYDFPTAVDWRNQALITAVAMGDYRRTSEMLDAGIDVNSKYTDDDDPSEWSLPIHLACEIGDGKMAKILVDAGADPNAVDSAGESAITRMAGRLGFTPGKAQILRYLATAGANLDTAGHSGYTPLQSAVLLDNFPLAEGLITLGATVNAADPKGDTALHFACHRTDGPNAAMIRLLLRHGADPMIKNRDLRTATDYMKEQHLEYLLSERSGR